MHTTLRCARLAYGKSTPARIDCCLVPQPQATGEVVKAGITTLQSGVKVLKDVSSNHAQQLLF